MNILRRWFWRHSWRDAKEQDEHCPYEPDCVTFDEYQRQRRLQKQDELADDLDQRLRYIDNEIAVQRRET